MAKCVLSHGVQNVKGNPAGASDQDLEDKLYQLREQNTILKREAHNANYQVKCLNTKLTRLVNEKKRLVKQNKSSHEVEMEELIFDMNLKLENVMRENERLHHNSLLLRTQLQPKTKKSARPLSSFANVKPRIDTGLEKMSKRPNTGVLSRRQSASMTNLNTVVPKVTFGPTPPHCRSESRTINGGSGAGDHAQLKTTDDNQFLVDEISFRLLKEAREEINTLEEVVANQQSYIESRVKKKKEDSNGYREVDDKYSGIDAGASGSIAIESSRNRSKSNKSLKSEQTPTDVDSVGNSQIEYRRGPVSERMKIYLGNLEQELKRAREEMSEIKDQLIFAKMNTIKVDELNRKVNSLQKENEILQESLSSSSLEMFTETQEKSMVVLQKSLKHHQVRIHSLELEKQAIEMELSSQCEKIEKAMEENFELRRTLNASRKQIEDMKSSCLSIVQPESSSQCSHHDLTQPANQHGKGKERISERVY